MIAGEDKVSLFTLDRVRYKQVLNIQDLVLPTNSIISIVGKSGSGKSTLLRLLNRMISPTSGTITYKSEPIDSIRPVELRRRVVMLPQNPIIFDGTLRDNVLKGLMFSERAAIDDQRIRHLLDMLEIDQELESRASWLSGGERQRVAIARVLAMQPEVLLLDEPSSALDDATQDTVIGSIVEESRRCNTDLIMVTHARDMAERWGDVLIELAAGEVISMKSGARHG